jgi:hypothetical protein
MILYKVLSIDIVISPKKWLYLVTFYIGSSKQMDKMPKMNTTRGKILRF